MAAPSTSENPPLGLFGLDLSRWPAQWRAAADLLLALPGIRALAPMAIVRAQGAGHPPSLWRLRRGMAYPLKAGNGGSAPGPAPRMDAQAAWLSRSAVLERTLTLPQLNAEDLAHAVQLEVSACSPFPAEQTVHGFLAEPQGQAMRVSLALTSRAQCQAALAQAGLDEQAEIWLEPAAAPHASGAPAAPSAPWRPLLMRGWGEAARQQQLRRGHWRHIGLLVLLLALLAALLVTPVAFERRQALQAQARQDALQHQVAPQMAQREAIGQRAQALATVAELAATQLSLPPVLDMLTRALPDSAWLSGIRVEGDKLVLNGMADDAAALVRRLAEQPGISQARLASPATRLGNDTKERFVIELRASAAQYGPLTLPASQAAAAAPSDAPPAERTSP